MHTSVQYKKTKMPVQYLYILSYTKFSLYYYTVYYCKYTIIFIFTLFYYVILCYLTYCFFS